MPSATPRDEPIPDNYLREIGRVAVEWSKVEAAIETVVWAFLFISHSDTSPWLRETEGRAVTTHINILLRVDIMLSLKSAAASTTLYPDQRVYDEVDELAKLVRALAPRRNKVVHSLWSPIGEMVLRQSYRARGDVSPFYDVMSLDDVKLVGDEAQALYERISNFIPKLNEALQEQRTRWYQRERK